MKFIVITGSSQITEKEMEAETLEALKVKINNTQRGKMEYSIFSGKPFTFNTLLFQHLQAN